MNEIAWRYKGGKNKHFRKGWIQKITKDLITISDREFSEWIYYKLSEVEYYYINKDES